MKTPKAPTLFEVVAPLGYKCIAVCRSGHPVQFQHEQTGGKYTPLTNEDGIVCVVCLATVVGMTCIRPHRAFEVCDA